MLKKISPQKAIANHCKGCIYDPLAGGTMREQIENCPIVRCELYNHRPRSKKAREQIKQDYLDSLTPEQRVEERIKRDEKAKIMRERMMNAV